MDQDIVQEMLHEMFASLEALDTQTAALRQFLKDKGLASDQDLAPYLEKAGNASGVRWLALRVRMDYLLSSAMKPTEKDAKDAKDAKKDSALPSENKNEKEAAAAYKTGKKESEKKDVTGKSRVDSSGKSAADESGAGLKEAAPEKDRNQNEEGNRTNNAAENAA